MSSVCENPGHVANNCCLLRGLPRRVKVLGLEILLSIKKLCDENHVIVEFHHDLFT